MNELPIRVLFLTRYPIAGASSRYRVFQYLPHLEQLGVQYTVQSFMNDELYNLSSSHGSTVKKILLTLKAIFSRLKVLRRAKSFDIIYMQRELFPFGPPFIERLLKKSGAILFFDYDDALFIKKSSRFNPVATILRSPEKTNTLFTLSDMTIAGNNWLRDAARTKGGRAETVEVAEDLSRFRTRDFGDMKLALTIGWLGSPSTVKYLLLIEPVLAKLAQDYPDLRFEIMGGGSFTMSGVPWKEENWSIQSEVEALSRFDIGLMPLPNEEWSKGKSGGKARTYMAAGVVPICTKIGYNEELISHGKTGFLCAELDDWDTSIRNVIANPRLRESISVAAVEEVRTRFSPNTQASKLFGLFSAAIQAKRTHSNL